MDQNQTQNHFQLITFDLDDTLWDVTPVITRAEEAMMAWLEANHPELCQVYDASQLRAIKDKILLMQPELQYQISLLRVLSLSSAFQGLGYDAHAANSSAQAAFEVFIKVRNNIDFFDATVETLKQLKSSYRIGALTNGNASTDKVGLGEYFEFCINGEAINSNKPAPLHFEQAKTVTGIDYQQMVHIGDHPEHDILGAQKLGVKTIWANLKNQKWQARWQADEQITHLNQLPAAIERLERLCTN